MPAPKALTKARREAILDAAALVFGRHGYEGASMTAITQAAGASKSTIYLQFGDKAGLFAAFVERECERRIVSYFATLPEQSGVADVLHELGRRIQGLLLSPTCLMVERVVSAEAWHFPDLAAAFYRAGPERAIALLAGWLTRQVQAGRLRIEDPALAAEQFYMLCQTRVVPRRRLGLPDHDPPTAAETVLSLAVFMFLRAYAVPPSFPASADVASAHGA